MVCITEEERRGDVEIFKKIGHIEGTQEESDKAYYELLFSLAKIKGVTIDEVKKYVHPVTLVSKE